MYAKVKAEKAAAEAERAKYAMYDANGNRIRRGDRPPSPEILRTPEDIRMDPKFSGETLVMVSFVPLHARDEKTEVDEETLRVWIITAIVEEDPYSKPFYTEIDEINLEIAKIDKKIRGIPKIEFLDDDGKPLMVDEARAEREKLFQAYGEERVVYEGQLETTQNKLKQHVQWRKSMGINFIKGDIDKNTETRTWFFKLLGTDDVNEMEDLIIKKENWPGIKLAAGDPSANPPIPPWAGRSNVPDGSKPEDPDYTMLQVNISGARISRELFGIGLIRKLDRSSANISDEEFGLFYGEFEAGNKNGYGVDFTDAGVYTGSYSNGFRSGNGRFDMADGTTIIGKFGVQLNSTIPQSIHFQNPYLEGEPHGEVDIYFADGGFFKGTMENGHIIGRGDYQSALNEVYSGTFQRGILHGPKCFHQNTAEDVYFGNFRYGELHGKGTFMNKKGDFYEGHWEDSMKHGRGMMKVNKVGTYKGYYMFGMKHGKGAVEYGKLMKSIDQKSNIKQEKKETPDGIETVGQSTTTEDEEVIFKDLSEFESIFQGYFIGNSMSNGGSTMNSRIQIPNIISKMNKRSVFPIMKVLRREDKASKLSTKTVEKFNDMELFIREEIARKKVRIYNQQKHFTKKMMYKEDVYQELNYKQLKSKLLLREERLKGIHKKDRVMTETARVPRLKLVNDKPMNAYINAYDRIHTNHNVTEPRDQINDKLLLMAISDFEEGRERQRFLKYDLIWQRAENAYLGARSAANDTGVDFAE